MSVRLSCAALMIVATAIAGIGRAAAQATSANAPPALNITRDSAPGWLPTERQRQDVINSANDYFSALDQGRYDGAYAMMSDNNRRAVPLERFIDESQKFRARSGALKQRSILKVTWTKGSAAAPLPGTYAAIDVASRYENIDRHCGYVVLYQKSDSDSFRVMRQEGNFIDNATAQNIEQKKSRAELDRLWATLAANCPNYDTGSPKPQ